MQVNPKALLAGAGAAFGIVAVTVGFWQAMLVAALTAAGWLAGKWMVNELGFVDEFLGKFFDKRRNRE